MPLLVHINNSENGNGGVKVTLPNALGAGTEFLYPPRETLDEYRNILNFSVVGNLL